MPKIFISYRRDDSVYVAQNINDKLTEHHDVVFDVDVIPKGVDFVEFLNQQVRECDVLLAVIGDRWLDVRGKDGSRRLDDPNDFVRIEIQAALTRNIPVIPVLVEKASMPAAGQLPNALIPLSRCNAAEVRAGRDFQTHLKRLVRDVETSLQFASRPPEEATPASPKPTSVDTSPPKHSGNDIITNSIGMQFKLIEPGTFLMGEEPHHQVTLTEPFRLGIYPVTRAEYERVMKENPSGFKDDERRPVEVVSWFNAIEFCNRLSEQEGLSPYYEVKGEEVDILNGTGYRLPTEAEWEYACRAGSTGAYCYGDDPKKLGEYAWFGENSGNETHVVGQKQPNALGLYDMHGNVWEWCWDLYGEYPQSPQKNPVGSSQGSGRVIRGGGWRSVAGRCRSAFRSWRGPGNRSGNDLGFRVAAVRSSKSSQ